MARIRIEVRLTPWLKKNLRWITSELFEREMIETDSQSSYIKAAIREKMERDKRELEEMDAL